MQNFSFLACLDVAKKFVVVVKTSFRVQQNNIKIRDMEIVPNGSGGKIGRNFKFIKKESPATKRKIIISI